MRARRGLLGVQDQFGRGAEQLKRYADLLSTVEGARSRTLVYITRDYDPKNETEVLRGSAQGPGKQG
jgi:hypothetical protein